MHHSESALLDCKALPKIELHAHLTGSISRQCLHEIWLTKRAAGETDLQDPLIEMPAGKFDYDLKTWAHESSLLSLSLSLSFSLSPFSL
ncbi:hypothetical protein VTG60DRAFT_4682 [Thermothelomyces hinnuleus]